MIPDLLEATQEYMQKLNALEAAYQRDEVSLEEVDAQVKVLMTELGQSRRQAFRALAANLRHTLAAHREAVAGALCLGLLTYAWLINS